MTTHTALITGAASGIGRATALAFASRGYTVFAIDQDPDGLNDVVAAATALGLPASGAVADVRDADAMDQAVADALTQFGRIDLAVSAAGVAVLGRVTDLQIDEWKRSIDINLTGTFLTARSVLPALVKTRGAFVAISSDAGVRGAQGYAAYAAAKHGVVGLIRTLALDHGPDGVRSNVVCPGFVDTPMSRRIFENAAPGADDAYRRTIPLGRFAAADDVASVVVHLAESVHTNGMVYSIDGGTTAGPFSPVTTHAPTIEKETAQ